jgi:hypothetical protein
MNVIEMAEQVGFERIKHTNEDWVCFSEEIEAFAKLVAEHEREECAKLAAETVCDVHLPSGTKIYGSRVATAIRARGTT